MTTDAARKQEAYELETLENAPTAEGYTGEVEYTAEEEAKIIRKLDYRLLPFLLLLYTFSVLDRSNLGVWCSSALCVSFSCQKKNK